MMCHVIYKKRSSIKTVSNDLEKCCYIYYTNCSQYHQISNYLFYVQMLFVCVSHIYISANQLMFPECSEKDTHKVENIIETFLYLFMLYIFHIKFHFCIKLEKKLYLLNYSSYSFYQNTYWDKFN